MKPGVLLPWRLGVELTRLQLAALFCCRKGAGKTKVTVSRFLLKAQYYSNGLGAFSWSQPEKTESAGIAFSSICLKAIQRSEHRRKGVKKPQVYLPSTKMFCFLSWGSCEERERERKTVLAGSGVWRRGREKDGEGLRGGGSAGKCWGRSGNCEEEERRRRRKGFS